MNIPSQTTPYKFSLNEKDSLSERNEKEKGALLLKLDAVLKSVILYLDEIQDMILSKNDEYKIQRLEYPQSVDWLISRIDEDLQTSFRINSGMHEREVCLDWDSTHGQTAHNFKAVNNGHGEELEADLEWGIAQHETMLRDMETLRAFLFKISAASKLAKKTSGTILETVKEIE